MAGPGRFYIGVSRYTQGNNIASYERWPEALTCSGIPNHMQLLTPTRQLMPPNKRLPPKRKFLTLLDWKYRKLTNRSFVCVNKIIIMIMRFCWPLGLKAYITIRMPDSFCWVFNILFTVNLKQFTSYAKITKTIIATYFFSKAGFMFLYTGGPKNQTLFYSNIYINQHTLNSIYCFGIFFQK